MWYVKKIDFSACMCCLLLTAVTFGCRCSVGQSTEIPPVFQSSQHLVWVFSFCLTLLVDLNIWRFVSHLCEVMFDVRDSHLCVKRSVCLQQCWCGNTVLMVYMSVQRLQEIQETRTSVCCKKQTRTHCKCLHERVYFYFIFTRRVRSQCYAGVWTVVSDVTDSLSRCYW